MAQILVRQLQPATVELWKLRAKRHGRSLEAEIRMLIEQEARRETEREEQHREFWRIANEMRARLATGGQVFPDSGALRKVGRRGE